MKKIFHLILFFCCCVSVNAQNVGVNNFGLTADPSAMLDVSSTNKGMLIPRMRGSDRLAITSPAEGLLVYDVDTKSVWYYSNGLWKEIPNTSYTLTPGGLALGDLYGSYPSPSVGKIQNLDVAFGVPFDRQILKWDALNNRWQGLNDSLFLPYNVTSGSTSRLFGITNANTTGGSSAIFGRSGITGSNFIPGPSVGVWGDNSTGFGVYGASTSGTGVNGASFSGHGIVGLSLGTASAGVYGNGNGTGVFGETSGGIGVKGYSGLGKAAVFENNSASNSDTLMRLVHLGTGYGISLNMNNTAAAGDALSMMYAGIGRGINLSMTNPAANLPSFLINNASSGQTISLTNSNTANNANMIFASQAGLGTGYYLSIANTLNNSPGIMIDHGGTGAAIEAYGHKGKAGLFQVANAANANTALDVSTLGTGIAGNFLSSNSANSSTVLVAATQGTGSAGTFSNTNSVNSTAVLNVSSAGTGRGINLNITNSTNTNAAISVVDAGTLGMAVTVNGANPTGISVLTGVSSNNAIAIKGVTGLNGTNTIGVLGQAGANDPNGIGVKGVAGSTLNTGIGVLGEGGLNSNLSTIGVKGTSYNVNHAVGSVTGINFSSGVGVYGEAQDFDGVGVLGLVGNTSQDSKAAQFKNVYSSNTFNVMEVISNGLNSSIFSDNTNLSNTLPLFRVRSAGTGDFLKFETNLGSTVTTVQKDGDVITAGTMVLRNNKGVVRNSTSTQVVSVLMSISIPAGAFSAYDPGGFNATVNIPVTFTSSFSANPFVFIGNATSGNLFGISPTITNVTTTGCTLVLQNWTAGSFSYPATTLRILAMGAE